MTKGTAWRRNVQRKVELGSGRKGDVRRERERRRGFKKNDTEGKKKRSKKKT